MKVLIMNRRDIRNPLGGGAEVYTHEAAKALIAGGDSVTVFTSIYSGAAAEEFIDGVRYLRAGGEFTVHFHGFLYALMRRKNIDLIIDEFNGLGFFGFLLPRSMLLIHQLYREFWFRALGPAGVLPYLIEPLLLRLYRKTPTLTVSDSTRQDLLALGFRDVTIVLNALDIEPLEALPRKHERPTLIFLGRMAPTKNPLAAVEIFRLLKSRVPGARLLMAGTGPQEQAVREAARKDPDITFLGWVSEDEKYALLREAHLLLVPGVREGFGINVIESAAQGTPAVGYDIPGLRDSIRDGETGLLARGPEDAAARAAELLADDAEYRRLALNCLSYARGFRWDERAAEFRRAAHGAVAGKEGRGRG